MEDILWYKVVRKGLSEVVTLKLKPKEKNSQSVYVCGGHERYGQGKES